MLLSDDFAWWRLALSLPEYELRVLPVTDEPQCGFFKRKLVKGGPFVPAKIWLDNIEQDAAGDLIDQPELICEVNGRRGDAFEQWLFLCSNPISQAEFEYMRAQIRWAKEFSPQDPIATPGKRIDWMKVPVPTFK